MTGIDRGRWRAATDAMPIMSLFFIEMLHYTDDDGVMPARETITTGWQRSGWDERPEGPSPLTARL